MELWANNASATLNAAITASATAIVLSAGQGARFPSPSGGDYFWLTLEKSTGVREITKCTGRAGDTLTVVRAQQGTAAATFAAGDVADNRLTKQTLLDLQAGGGGGSGDARGMTQAQIDALAWVNQGTATLTMDPTAPVATLKLPDGDTDSQVRLAKKAIPAPSGDWRYRVRMWMAGPDSDFHAAGLVLRESATGKLVVFVMAHNSGAPTKGLRVWRFTDETTFNSELASITFNSFNEWMHPTILEIERLSGALYFRWNHGEGGKAFELFTESVSASFTAEPNEIGLAGYIAGSFDAYSNFGMFEKVS